jgi:hypothetical protein
MIDWREHVTTCRGLCGLLCSHSDIVCLVIQSIIDKYFNMGCVTFRSSCNITSEELINVMDLLQLDYLLICSLVNDAVSSSGCWTCSVKRQDK